MVAAREPSAHCPIVLMDRLPETAVVISQTFHHLHERLRSQTRSLHDDAERALDLEARLSSIEAYCCLLHSLWQLHAGYEAAFGDQPWSSARIDFEPRRRSNMLLADLSILGDSTVTAMPSSVPMHGIFDAIGCLYVIEGSTLGGQIIFQRIRERLGAKADGAASFFRGYGPETGGMWRALIAAINTTPAYGADADAMEAGARRTFSTFISFWDGAIVH
jgi:heme oxygenase (biliverdin-IX-beta and delta-forming)